MHISKTLAIAVAATFVTQVPVFAQTTCSDETIAGRYAVHGQGWTGTATLEPLSPEVVVGTHYFDGKGTFTGSGYQSIAGLSRWFTTSGTYNVKPDCVITVEGTSTSPSAAGAHEVISWFGVVTDAGNKVYVIRIKDGATTSTEYVRITPID